MFTVMQETESGQKIWPNIDHVYTASGERPGEVVSVTALFAAGGLMDFPMSRKMHNIYVMNEAGATVAKYYIGNNPRAPDPNTPPPFPDEQADPELHKI